MVKGQTILSGRKREQPRLLKQQKGAKLGTRWRLRNSGNILSFSLGAEGAIPDLRAMRSRFLLERRFAGRSTKGKRSHRIQTARGSYRTDDRNQNLLPEHRHRALFRQFELL